MSQPFRKGHYSKNPATVRRIERKQRAWMKQYLRGDHYKKNRKKKNKMPQAKESKPYPCSAKQFSLGEPIQ